MKYRLLFFSLISVFYLNAQTVNYQFTKDQHQKEIIGYFTNWDAWKGTNHGVPAGFFNQLNIDYSQYTILNWSFFGVANDGSLHSGDFRNQNIHLSGQVQQPAAMFNTDIYSSWDLWLRDGELEVIQYLPDDLDTKPNHAQYWAYQDHGYKGNGSGWIHTDGTTGSYPLPLPKPNGKKGLIALAHDNNVKVMASIGGWSMSKHFPEMAADSVKRSKFIQDCVTLVNDYDFDGIDIDWEFPGPFAGMNFTGSNADYANFTTLMAELRAAIGPNKLISAAFNADPVKLAGFNWTSLNTTMDYYNMMSYDMHGGWSNKAGHNSPLYPYTNQETAGLSWHTTFQYLVSQGVSPSKINMGVGFYGRGVITNGPASLNAPTVKVQKNVNPDGPVMTAADYTNWGAFDGTPNYDYILDNMSGWTYHWDNEAKVPYLTKGNFFLSYDDVNSITEKAKYVDSNNIAGVIVWQTFGDLNPGTVTATYANKLPHAPSTTAPLVNTINKVFSGNYVPSNNPPAISFLAPNQDTTISQDTFTTVPVSIKIEDLDGSVANASFELNGQPVNFTQNGNTYSYNLLPNAYGDYVILVNATDNDTASATDSLTVNISNDTATNRISHIMTSALWDQFFPHRFGVGSNNAGTGDFYSYANFVEAINRMANIKIVFERRCGTNIYKITRIDKSTSNSIVIREDAGFATSNASIITQEVDYGSFGNDGTLENQQREIMAFLANISQETTGGWPTAPGGQYSYGLYFNEEQGYSNGGSLGYIDAGSTLYPPTPGKSYHGRGPIQLSWNTNYGQVSAFLYGDKQVLLDNPENVLLDGAVAFQTAIWFWMTPQYPKPSAHDIMVENWQPTAAQVSAGIVPGFGATVNIINPAIECNSGTESPKVLGRIAHFDRYTDILGIGMALDGSDNPTELGCANMSPFQIDVNECNNVTGIAFSTPNDGDTIAIHIGDTIPLSLNVSDPNNVLTNIQMTVSGNTFNGSTGNWVPAAFGNYTLTATAQNSGNSISDVINVTLIDASNATGCEGVNAWSASDIYAAAGQEVVYNNKLYENKWWTQNEAPGSNQVWEYIRTCGTDTTISNVAPTISAIIPADSSNINQASLASVAISFTVNDVDGTIQTVSATVNGNNITLTNTGNAYSGSFTPTVYGVQQLSITATDNDNASSTSQTVFNIVAPTSNQAPSITAVTPANGSSINQTSLSAINVSFDATDTDGTVQTVTATINGSAVTLSSNGSTYSGSYTPTVFGSHTLSISAMDNDSATTTAQSLFTINADTSTCSVSSWQAQVYATPGTQVSWNNRIYENQWYAAANEVPGSNNVWLFISYCNGGPDLSASCGYEVWDTNAVYATAGTKVFYNGKIYENKWWVTNEAPDALVAWMYVEDCNPTTSAHLEPNSGNADVHIEDWTTNETSSNEDKFNTERTFAQVSPAHIAPNPATTVIQIISEKEILKATILNGYGRPVLSTQRTQIDISGLNTGLNFVQIQYQDGTTEIIKFMKSNK
ncbi:T9SS type A sorting domain-containing protein [bacterium SCSIO 12643]|nr:T9SS type A sorting domain-containing protein [bacterium SCSIO 12643]